MSFNETETLTWKGVFSWKVISDDLNVDQVLIFILPSLVMEFLAVGYRVQAIWTKQEPAAGEKVPLLRFWLRLTYRPGEPVHSYLVHVVRESLRSLQLEISQHVIWKGSLGSLGRTGILVNRVLSLTWVLPGLRWPRWRGRELSVFSCWLSSHYWTLTAFILNTWVTCKQ